MCAPLGQPGLRLITLPRGPWGGQEGWFAGTSLTVMAILRRWTWYLRVIFLLSKAFALSGLVFTLTPIHMVTTEAILFIIRDEWSSFQEYTDRKLTSGHWLSFPSCPVASFHYLHPFTAEPRRDTCTEREEETQRIRQLHLYTCYDKFLQCNQIV